MLSLSLLVSCAANGSGEVTFDQVPAAGPAAAEIVVRPDQVVASFDRRLLGANVPAWLSPELVTDPRFAQLIDAAGITSLRLPGGSWSNHYDWLACEMDDPDRCEWTWALRPSDFVGLLEATDQPAMWTVSINGTAEEAAAAVAFFNGAVDDERVIGVDRNGRDWMSVGHWARLRAERGYAQPVDIAYWEVGNEVYGARPEAGPACVSWGWEDVWTCDGDEYVRGTTDHDGFLRFRQAMLEVDPDIAVGIVGAGDRTGWDGWDDAVMAAAGPDFDFYVVHSYGSNGDLAAEEVLDVPSSTWPRVAGDIREGYRDHGVGDRPIAVTEHNLVAFMEGDDERLMTKAVNALYLASTIGQMAANGVAVANQWNVANGRGDNGTDYGLVDTVSLHRSPAYYAIALWARVAGELVRVEAGGGVADLELFAGRGADGSVWLIAVNPTENAIDADIVVDQAEAPQSYTADVVAASALEATDVTFNGSASPSLELTEPGRVVAAEAGKLEHSFPAASITLLRSGLGDAGG